MSSHAYAFKFDNKTLGIKDVDQLKRLLDSGKINENDSVFVIDIKRWVKISHLPEYARLLASETEVKSQVRLEEPAKGGQNKPLELVQQAPRTRAFARLIDELDDNEEESTEYQESGDAERAATMQFDSIENVKTIHKVAGTKNNNRFEAMVAAKHPVPESNWGSKTAIAATAILVLLLGVVAGFIGASTMQQDTMPQKVNTVLQANTSIPSADKN